MPKETLKKVMNGDVPVGPDKYYGGDGLPDWMQFTISLLLFGLLYWILNLLFHLNITNFLFSHSFFCR